MDVYEKALRGRMRRLSELIAISAAKIKFVENIWSMYADGLLTLKEYRELFDMAKGESDG